MITTIMGDIFTDSAITVRPPACSYPSVQQVSSVRYQLKSARIEVRATLMEVQEVAVFRTKASVHSS